MGTSRSPGAFRRAAKIGHGEGKLAFLAFSYLFLIAAPNTIINALRTTHFVWLMNVDKLPVAYLIAAVVTGLFVYLFSILQGRGSIFSIISWSLVFFSVSALVVHAILQTKFGQASAVFPYVYWTWASLLIVVAITGFWMTVNEIYNPREARRLLGLLNTGGILGGIFGGLLVGLFSRGALGQWLLPLASAMLFACALVLRAIHKTQAGPVPGEDGAPAPSVRPKGRKEGFLDSLESIKTNRLLTLIALIVGLGVIVSTCIEFQFLAASYSHYLYSGAGKNSLQAFLGFFEPALTVFALGMNFLMAKYIVRWLKPAFTSLATPATILAGSLAILLTPFGLLSGIFIRGCDEGLSYSVSYPVREILYIPVAAGLRRKAKAFIEMFVSQFAQVVGALVLWGSAVLLGKTVVGLTPAFDPGLAKSLSWVTIAFVLPLAWISFRAGRQYREMLRENIKPIWEQAEKGLEAHVDVEYAKLVFDTIDSRNRSSVLYALHLFDLLERDRLSPEVMELIEERSEEVEAAALTERLSGGEGPSLPQIPDDLQAGGALSEIPLILSSAEYQQVMASYAETILEGGPDSQVQKMELAKALGWMKPDSPLASRLPALIGDASPVVSSLALRSAGRLKRDSDIPWIIGRFGNFVTLEDAVQAASRYGDAAVPPLDECLRDASRGVVVRVAAIEALARIGTQAAAGALLGELEQGSDDLAEAVIDGLDRIRAKSPGVVLPASVIKSKTRYFIKEYCLTYFALRDLVRSGEDGKQRDHLARNLESLVESIFKLLGLCYPQEDIRKAYQNIRKGTRNSTAHAVEWLDHALDNDVKSSIIPIVEELDPAVKESDLRKVIRGLSGLKDVS